ncbi:chromosome partitioning protein [Allokutzneria sp. A3M-2-11 16]|uniref:chromosome partitioning protein n=1 Tax=Allokutzneria sp. A3M-2-11 16 TaxID=2962043 RepID=UPI0020B69E3B|nr:chromosome partitioning protein [Allokutzneria sp. A3M-2-11 16]MCP3800698.1 chromosome partitioning protein [Allokutzneria sp. A3M-2-11 16]
MLVAVASVKGSPGVSVFSLALAACWPAPARTLLIEADPSGGDVGVRMGMATTPGLVSLAAAARHAEDLLVVWQHAQVLPLGLPVVAAPADGDRARTALSALTSEPGTGTRLVRAIASEAVVIVDCGRIEAGSPGLPLARCADALILLSRAHAADLAHLAHRLPAIGGWTPQPVLLLVGNGYSPAEVARELRVAPLGRIPDDPRGAALLCGRTIVRPGSRVLERSAVGGVARKVATTLLARRAIPIPRVVEQRLAPGLHVVPGVPTAAISANGLKPAPQPFHEEIPSRGGRAS